MRRASEDASPLATDLLESLYAIQVAPGAPVPTTELVDNWSTAQNVALYNLNQAQLKTVIPTLNRAQALATNLGYNCQAYEIDDIKLGDPFDETAMDCAPQPDVDDDSVVSCVIAKGWVRKTYKGAPEIQARICKARVLVTSGGQAGDLMD